MKCCFKDFQRQGEAIEELDLYVCDECLEELERLAFMKYQKLQDEANRPPLNNQPWI
jgi:SUMO ligase MMS21 Smc5/6 complex component